MVTLQIPAPVLASEVVIALPDPQTGTTANAAHDIARDIELCRGLIEGAAIRNEGEDLIIAGQTGRPQKNPCVDSRQH